MLSKVTTRKSASASPLSTIRQRAGKVANLWIYESPKNRKRLTVAGDVVFMHMILLEGDPDVQNYAFVGDPFCLQGPAPREELPGYVDVTYVNGEHTWIRVKRSSIAGTDRGKESVVRNRIKERALEARAAYAEYSELELRGRELEFENWLILCGCINRAKDLPDYVELSRYTRLVRANSGISVRTLLEEEDCDPAVMLAVIAKSLQCGTAVTELRKASFCPETVIQRRAQ